MTARQAQVPLLDLQAQYAPIREEVIAAITRVCDSQRFIMGPEITSLERLSKLVQTWEWKDPRDTTERKFR